VSHLSYLSFFNQGPSLKSNFTTWPSKKPPIRQNFCFLINAIFHFSFFIFHLIRAITQIKFHNMALKKTTNSTKPLFFDKRNFSFFIFHFSFNKGHQSNQVNQFHNMALKKTANSTKLWFFCECTLTKTNRA